MTESTSVDDVPIFVYPGSRAVEIPSEPKTAFYSALKRPEMTKSMSIDDVPIFMYPGSRALEIAPDSKNVCYNPLK